MTAAAAEVEHRPDRNAGRSNTAAITAASAAYSPGGEMSGHQDASS